MAEFAQNGAIVTLHRLGGERAAAIQAELEHFARTRHITLVLPCRFDDLSRPTFAGILDSLRRVAFLDRIVVSLGATPPGGLQAAQQCFSTLPQSVSIVWNDGPRVRALCRQLAREGFDAGCEGKGKAFWVAMMYALSRGDCDVIAAHECDITTYGPELLARLCYPVVHPGFDFEFAKGYYARVRDNEMFGRVTRLFVAPLLRAMQTVVGASPILTYLESFRYPLSGEFAMKSSLARLTSVPSDCALEIGMLTETYYNCELTGICQTELTARYDRRHEPIGDDCDSGLLKMCVDVARTLFETMAAEGMALRPRGWRELTASYREAASELVNRYRADAAINGLTFARSREDLLVASFERALQVACERHAAGLPRAPLLPSWTQVTSAIPSFGEWLWEAVELDGSPSASHLAPTAVL